MNYYTLSGNITTKKIEQTDKAFTEGYDLTKLSSITSVWNELNSKGTLRIIDGTYRLDKNLKMLLLTFHRIELENATIITNSSNLTILCNEFRFKNSRILSFESEEFKSIDAEKPIDSGEDGRDGIEGLDGGNVKVLTTDKIIYTGRLNINLSGQDGGDGGNGNNGGRGRTGSSGTNCNGDITQCYRDCGNGGRGRRGQTGGDGGKGGNGGSAGVFDFRLHGYSTPSPFIFNYTGKGGFGGNGGYAGSGGDGGSGGSRGRMGCGAHCNRRCYPGPRGHRGANGRNGNQGNIGNDNSLVNANFDITYLSYYLHALQNSNNIDKILIDEVTLESGIKK